MSKQKKGMHKEYHTKRIDSDLDFVLNYVFVAIIGYLIPIQKIMTIRKYSVFAILGT